MNDMNREDLLALVTNKTGWTRRDFVASSLATGFALAVQPVCAQTVITTDTQGLTAGEVKIATKDGDIPAYRSMPATGKNFPVILVVQEIFGVHEHIKDVTRRFAKLGYMAIAPELYYRQGDVSKMTDTAEIFTKVVNNVPDAQVMSDLDSTVAWAGKNGGNVEKLGITGFCWGGRITWLYTAHNPKVDAGVAWYGRLVGDKSEMTPTYPIDLVGKINAPVLGLYGGADAGIPNDTVERMNAALKKAGKKSEIHLYPDTPHAFNADYRPSYRKAQADDGWKRAIEWFRKNGVA
ncbi:MAG: carboxymethylenebutenolidase [Betaproteobacteria bacterium]|nr:carboxymethylenebutenolidase [Betaproteobacteria bacterium]